LLVSSYGGLVMMSTVVIPAEVIDLLRDGLRSQIASASQRIISATGQLDAREHPEREQDPLRCIYALNTLMDEIGWSTPPNDLQVDLETHAWALLEALQDQVSVHANMLRESDRDHERREVLAREMNAVSTLALTVLLKTQARVLRPGPGLPGVCEKKS
jgi:hypothetical protein